MLINYGANIVSLSNGELPIILEESADVLYIEKKSPSGPVLVLQTTNIEEAVRHLKTQGEIL